MDASNLPEAVPSILTGQPWRKHVASCGDKAPVTMLRPDEINLLHWLAATFYQGNGAIVDAGCFLGGSTYALASGLAQNRSPAAANRRIDTFDCFSTAGPLWYPNLEKFGLAPNQSFLERF